MTNVSSVGAEYLGAPFSDHMLLLVSIESTAANPIADNPFKPHFKIKPDIAKDELFQARVHQTTEEWEKAKDKLPLLVWWDYLKKDIRLVAKQTSKEKADEQKALLNFLMVAQSHLSRKVSKGQLELLPKLKDTQSQINDFFDKRSEKVKLHSQAKDMQESEKARIFHYEKFYRNNNKSSIRKLKTPDGIIEGHNKCAKYLHN